MSPPTGSTSGKAGLPASRAIGRSRSRRTDAVGSGTYTVTALGNDGTFSGPSTVTIPANGSASYPVHIGPVSAGIHSEILRLDDASSPGIEYQVLNTVVAAEQFSGPGYAITKNATPDRADKKSFFVNVAEGTPVLQLSETVNAGRTQARHHRPVRRAVPEGAAVQLRRGLHDRPGLEVALDSEPDGRRLGDRRRGLACRNRSP